MKTRTAKQQQKIEMLLPVSDAHYVLEGVARTLLRSGLSREKAMRPLMNAANRLLRVAVTDRNIQVSDKVLDEEARKIAAKLLRNPPKD